MPNQNTSTSQQISKHSQLEIQANKKTLRASIRKKRRNLSDLEQKRASKNLSKQIKTSQLLLKHRYIALYLGNDGELDPKILIKLLLAQKKQVYLPVIDPLRKNMLRFCRILPDTMFVKNRFGILEPRFDSKRFLQRQFLSLVLMPLVAFDKDGNRMGMGGGFYDRSFAYKLKRIRSKPKLMGIAHAFQEQESLPIANWDIPLDGIITDRQLFFT